MTNGDTPSFDRLFGRPASVTASAPGRVNLIGEHTDYNGGFVLPTAIPQTDGGGPGAARRPGCPRVERQRAGPPGCPTLRAGRRVARRRLDRLRAGRHLGARRRRSRAGGFDARLTSEVPLGSGLSSSAALEVGLMRALRTAFGLALDDVPLALLAQRAENEFVGAPVGIMDQMACSLGRRARRAVPRHAHARLRAGSPPAGSRACRDQLGRRPQSREGRLSDAPRRVRAGQPAARRAAAPGSRRRPISPA